MKTDISNIQDLKSFAAEFGKAFFVEPFSVILFRGTLGTGKTTTISLIANELNVKDVIQSPTYVIVREYPLDLPAERLYHIDLYRLSSIEEIFEYGIFDLLALKKGIFCIEWPELLEEELREYLSFVKTVSLSFEGEKRFLELR